MDFPLRGFLFLFMEFTSWSKTHIQRNSQSEFYSQQCSIIPDDVCVMYAHVNAHIIVDLSSLPCKTGRKTGGDVFSLVCACG